MKKTISKFANTAARTKTAAKRRKQAAAKAKPSTQPGMSKLMQAMKLK